MNVMHTLFLCRIPFIYCLPYPHVLCCSWCSFLSFFQMYTFHSLVESISVQPLQKQIHCTSFVRQLLSNCYRSIIIYLLSFASFSFVTFTLLKIHIARRITSISVNSNTPLLFSLFSMFRSRIALHFT